MLRIFTTIGCTSAKHLKEHLKTHQIAYEENNLHKLLLDTEKLESFLCMHEEEWSYLFPTLEKRKVDASFVAWLQNHPSCLQRPLIFDDTKDVDLEGLRAYARQYCNAKSSNWLLCGKSRLSD
ncbi:MAG: hypothetical protein J6D29_07670 [Solobacterium sp.]|nr:hypothetical protein [Solobacterium sp.]